MDDDEYGYDAFWVSHIPKHFRCVKCKFVLRDPVMIVGCRHELCRSCLHRVKRYARNMGTGFHCPAEGCAVDDVTKVSDDVILKGTIDGLRVRCWNLWCSWEGELRELRNHKIRCVDNNNNSNNNNSRKENNDNIKEDLLQPIPEEHESIKQNEKSDEWKDKFMKLQSELEKLKSCETSDKISIAGTITSSRIRHSSNSSSLIPPEVNILERYRGYPTSLSVSTNNHVQFYYWSTVAAPCAFLSRPTKSFYEVTFGGKVEKGEGAGSFVGWASEEFKVSEHEYYECVGWCKNSWGYDAQHNEIRHDDKKVSWGKQFPQGIFSKGEKYKFVLGVAADLGEGRFLYGVDGLWSPPMGEAFRNVDFKRHVFPAISGHNLNVFVNFGEVEFAYGPPDESYEKLCDSCGLFEWSDSGRRSHHGSFVSE